MISAHCYLLLQRYCSFPLITTAENQLLPVALSLLLVAACLLRHYLTVTASFLYITTSLWSHYYLLLRSNGVITTCDYVEMAPLLPVTTVVMGSLLLITYY